MRAAVSYIGNGATQHLPLKRGDVLIVNGSDNSLMAGSTNPTVLRAFTDKEVAVWSYDTLHSKVIATSSCIVVGSANASAHSVGTLDESVIITDDPDAVSAATEYIADLRKKATPVDETWLSRAEGLFRTGYERRKSNLNDPPDDSNSGPDTGLDETSRLWLGRVFEAASDAQVDKADGRPFIGVADEDPTKIGDLVTILSDVTGLREFGRIDEVVGFDGEGDSRVAIFAKQPWRPDKRRGADREAMETLLNDSDDNWFLVEGREAIEALIPVKD